MARTPKDTLIEGSRAAHLRGARAHNTGDEANARRWAQEGEFLRNEAMLADAGYRDGYEAEWQVQFGERTIPS